MRLKNTQTGSIVNVPSDLAFQLGSSWRAIAEPEKAEPEKAEPEKAEPEKAGRAKK